MSTELDIRRAEETDRDELRAMQASSFRTLGSPFYDADVIESFIGEVGTMDDSLLSDGTYLKVVDKGRIVASGGWSCRMPGYASRVADGASAPGAARATVRSIFVHPDCTRRGIARAMMAMIEAEIAAAGFRQASLTATLSGIPLYRHLGYRSGQPVEVSLPNALLFVGLAMEKQLVGRALSHSRAR